MKSRKILCEVCKEETLAEVPLAVSLVMLQTHCGQTHVCSALDKEDLTKVLLQHGVTIQSSQPIKDDNDIYNGVCDTCLQHYKSLEETVTKGGVYYVCEECGDSGALPPSSLSMVFRKKEGEAYTQPDNEGNYSLFMVSFSKCASHKVNVPTEHESNDTLH